MNQNSYAMKLAAFVSVGLMSVCGSYAGDFLKVDINTASSPVQEGWRSYVWSKNAAGTAQRVAYDGIPTSNAPEGVVGVTIVAGKGLDSAAAVTPDATTTSTIYSFDRTTVSCESAASLAAVYRDGIISDNQWANYFYYVTVDGLKPNVGYRFRSYHHDNGKKTEVKVAQLDRAELETTVASVAGATFVSADDADKFCSTQCVRTDASGKFVIRIRGSVEQARFNGFVLGEFADAGLHHEHSLNASFSADKVDEAADDNRGAIYGYAPWPNAGANNWCQSHRYTGYIRVPGNPGEKVTCNFVSSMARRTQLWIGGKLVIHTDDNTDCLTGATFTNRFYLGPQVELESGWQAVEIRFENWWEGAGPASSQPGWEANFGAGVDWQGRCDANPANYVKFLDPGDGSFLKVSMATKDKLDPAKYRATFGVELYCAPGTTLDLNDYLPYTPATVTRLSGCPRIAGGEIVASGWMLSVADIKKDQPLIVAADAVLGFDADAELVLDMENDGVVALPRRNGSRLPVVRVEDGGVLKSVPKLRRDGIGGWRLVPSDDGKGYDLLLVSGFIIEVR